MAKKTPASIWLTFRARVTASSTAVKNKAIKHPGLDRLVKTSFKTSPDFRPVLNKYSCPDTPGAVSCRRPRCMERIF